MSIVATVQVLPPSVVVRPLVRASLRTRVFPKAGSAESRIIFVDK